MSAIIKQLLAEATQKLKASDTKTSQLDAEVLLKHVLGKPREWILTHPHHKLSQKQAFDYNLLLGRRIKKEPIAYITGHKEFFGLDFEVNQSTLIPRPETELLVEEAVEYVRTIQKTKNIILVDIGTGSGNIIISLVKALDEKPTSSTQKKRRAEKNFVYLAIETSIDALKIAKINAKKHKVDERINFLSGRLLNPIIQNPDLLPMDRPTHISSDKNSKLLVLANLPYLSEEIYCSTPASVRLYEPKSALLSGFDGLDHYRKLLNQIKTLVKFYGLPVAVFLEISPEQKTLITKEIKSHYPKVKMNFVPDLAGKTRLVKFEV